jgi:hypothetical protein
MNHACCTFDALPFQVVTETMQQTMQEYGGNRRSRNNIAQTGYVGVEAKRISKEKPLKFEGIVAEEYERL